MSDPIDVSTLRALARDAQSGPWKANGPDVDMTGGRCAIVFRSMPAPLPGTDNDVEPEDLTTARYLAALSPDVVVALLDQVEALEAERVHVSAALLKALDRAYKAEAERTELGHEVDHLRRENERLQFALECT